MTTTTSFTRVLTGALFTTKDGTYRKASKHGGFRILTDDAVRPNRGQTHKEVAFTRSASVQAKATDVAS